MLETIFSDKNDLPYSLNIFLNSPKVSDIPFTHFSLGYLVYLPLLIIWSIVRSVLETLIRLEIPNKVVTADLPNSETSLENLPRTPNTELIHFSFGYLL